MPYLSRAADRPQITHGVQSGDVGADGGVVWARADRPSQMMVEVATTKSFKNARAAAADRGAARERLHRENAAGKSSRRAGHLLSRPLPRPLAYRRHRASRSSAASAPRPADRRDVSFVWGGDVAGQGWGINPDDGGMVTFATMRKHRPDFLLHSGDTIYADGVIPSEVKLADGKIWKNVTIPEKAKVAETLDEFRAAHKYNFLDENVRAFNAEVPIFVQWDDHEVTNNWSAVEGASRRLQGARHLAARRARGARLPRDVSDAREHRRAGPGLSHPELRSASRRLHAGRAQLSRPQRAEPADRPTAPTAISSGRISWPG